MAQATDPASGQIDTRTLSGWVAQAGQYSPQVAEQARVSIETELIAGGHIGELSRFNQDLRDGTAALPGSFGLPGMLLEGGRQALVQGGARLAQGQALAAAGTSALVNNPILNKVWESTPSAWTQGAGFRAPLREVLGAQGISVEPRANPVPAGSISSGQGVASAVANNHNGALARDAIAARYGQAFPSASVRREVTVDGGGRRIDVRVDIPAADPRLAQRIDIESKAGRTGSSATTRAQAAADGAELRANRAARQAGLALEEAGQGLSRTGAAWQTVGRVARPVAVAVAALEVGQAYRADGHRIGEHTGRAASGLAGGAAGAWGGVAAGAAIGSVVPVVGTVIGGIVGGVIGGLAGDAAGRGLFNAVKSWF